MSCVCRFFFIEPVTNAPSQCREIAACRDYCSTMAFTTNHPAHTTRLTPAQTALISPIYPSAWLQQAAEADLAAVHHCARMAQHTMMKWLAISTSKLGNGWIYLILAPVVALDMGWCAMPVIASAIINAAFLHLIYPVIKRLFRRRRPYHVDQRLTSLLKTLDEYSFPSGHVMTLTGVLLPIILAIPAAREPALVLILIMAWSRMATAHHYPSDVIAGITIGIMIAFPLTRLMMAFY